MRWPFVKRSTYLALCEERNNLAAQLAGINSKHTVAVNGLRRVKAIATPNMANIGKRMVAEANYALSKL